MPLLIATDIRKSYRRTGQADTVVLRGVSLSVSAGEFVALVGPSGAGKSTLLHILASLDDADSGSIELTSEKIRQASIGSSNVVNYASIDDKQRSRLRNEVIGMVFQFHHLLPEFTAVENVMMPLLIAGVADKAARARAMTLLEKVSLAHRAPHMPSELSGGEQARVAIARALINDPAILFADEPTGNLDSANATAVVDLLCDLQRTSGITCVIATHSDEIARRAQRVVKMKDGLFTS
ncbi:MAG: ABC transporter ATP-binding protein [bacterium]|nr:ABC transporter ATP-binding protein [bacterium]